MKSRKIIFTTVLSALVCFGLMLGAKAVEPAAPDTALPGGNTADGQSALGSLTTGQFNSAFGFFSLLSNGAASFNTGVGAGTLLFNTADQNTAVAARMISTVWRGRPLALQGFSATLPARSTRPLECSPCLTT